MDRAFYQRGVAVVPSIRTVRLSIAARWTRIFLVLPAQNRESIFVRSHLLQGCERGEGASAIAVPVGGRVSSVCEYHS